MRDDQPRQTTGRADRPDIRDEVVDPEGAGIALIQIDEPALREGLPLRRAQWAVYLRWAARAFHLFASGERDETQIHTHMWYAELDDIHSPHVPRTQAMVHLLRKAAEVVLAQQLWVDPDCGLKTRR